MEDENARGKELVKEAEKKLKSWSVFGSSKYEDAAELFEQAAIAFKLAKSWDLAGAVYLKLATCHMKLENRNEAASACADAGLCYQKCDMKESIACLEHSAHMYLEIGRLQMSAKHYEEIAELYEQEQNLEQAIMYYERAADLYQSEDVISPVNRCKEKIAQIAALLEQYPKSIKIYEEMAQQLLGNKLLRYGVRGHLLNAGICQLCRGDYTAINNALERYQELDPTFYATREYKLLADLAMTIDEVDVAKFTDAVKQFDSFTKLDAWKTTLLLRVKESLNAMEMEEDDLT